MGATPQLFTGTGALICEFKQGWLTEVEGGLEVVDALAVAGGRIAQGLLRYEALAIRGSTELLPSGQRVDLTSAAATEATLVDQEANLAEINSIFLANGSTLSIDVYVGTDPIHGLIEIPLMDWTAPVLGVDEGSIDLSDPVGARSSLAVLEAAAASVDEDRGWVAATRDLLEVHHERLSIDLELCGELVDPAAPEPVVPPPDRSVVTESQLDNLDDGRAAIQIVEVTLDAIEEVIGDLRWVVEQGTDPALPASERAVLGDGYQVLEPLVDVLADSCSYGGIDLCNGSTPSVELHWGTGNVDGVDRITVSLPDLSTIALGIDAGSVDLTTVAGSEAALAQIDAALAVLWGEASELFLLEQGLDALQGAIEDGL
ncbi:MAG TPA: hypothetical protein ENK18_03530 [Deltaproteobacteria bacterium]|nr:hypothetical protein [Deltaproteobacteria bacterium]